MERSLRFLDWQAKWWDDRQARPNPGRVPHLEEGAKAYAAKQAEIQRGLRDRFLKQWNVSLGKEEVLKGVKEAADRTAREELGLDGGDDDEDEDEDEDEEEAGNDGGDTEMPDRVEEEGEEEAHEAEYFGFA